MGGGQSKSPRKKGKIYNSDPKLTPTEACKNLEAKVAADGIYIIITVATDITPGPTASIFSPRGLLMSHR